MKPGYTEFSFGYAFTENLIRSSANSPGSAPYFPNLVQEATLGYDVRIDLPAQPLFFQFKLPEVMVRNSAAEIKHHALPGLMPPFFRMPLMRRDLSQQHSYLMSTEMAHPDCVFYATPELGDLSAFNNAYAQTEMHNKTVFFSPTEIGPLPDNKSHSIAYAPHVMQAWFCSEPKGIKRASFSKIASATKSRLEENSEQSLEILAFDIGRSVIDAIKYRRTRDVQEGFAVESVYGEPSYQAVSIAQTGPYDARISIQVENLVSVVRERVRHRMSRVAEPTKVSPRTTAVVEELVVARELARVGLGIEVLVAQPPLENEEPV